jgi:hypothetical protein
MRAQWRADGLLVVYDFPLRTLSSVSQVSNRHVFGLYSVLKVCKLASCSASIRLWATLYTDGDQIQPLIFLYHHLIENFLLILF